MAIQITARLEHPDGGYILSVLDDGVPALLLFIPKLHWWEVHVTSGGRTIRTTRTFTELGLPEAQLIQTLLYQTLLASS